MKHKRKAILLSALVLPGLGQLALRRYKSAMIILIAVVISLYQFMSVIFQQANEAVSRLTLQGGPLDMQAISQAASQSAKADSSYNIYIWIILVCWLISLFDILYVKHKADKKSKL